MVAGHVDAAEDLDTGTDMETWTVGFRQGVETGFARMTPAERATRGKQALRAAVPRESNAAFEPPADRPDPISLLEEQATSRVPELVPIRWGRMMVSPFTV